MSTCLVILSIAIGLLALLMVLPFDFTGRGVWGSDKRYLAADLKWAGGLVALSFKVPGPAPITLRLIGLTLWRGGKKGKSLPQSQKTKRAKKKNNNFNWRMVMGLLSDKALWRAGMVFLRRLVKALRLEVKLAGGYDFDDPCLNGMAAGLQSMLGGNRWLKLHIQPDFTQEATELTGYLHSRVIPAELLLLGMKFFWQKPVRRVWLSAIKNKVRVKKGAMQRV